jgi:D-alanyl-D-alanine carboxypeptidase
MVEPTSASPRPSRSGLLATLVIIGGAAIAFLGSQATATATSAPNGGVLPGQPRRSLSELPAVIPTDTDVPPRPERRPALGEEDGLVPDGTTVFDDGTPAVANLEPALIGALAQAAGAAASDGIEILIESGWRSAAYQRQLLREAVANYGSEAEAARWVATPATSAHVSGEAVDVGRADATAWLSEHGSAFGLCQVYANEPWHFELRPDAVDHGCPPLYPTAAHDPRLRR